MECRVGPMGERELDENNFVDFAASVDGSDVVVRDADDAVRFADARQRSTRNRGIFARMSGRKIEGALKVALTVVRHSRQR